MIQLLMEKAGALSRKYNGTATELQAARVE